MKTLTKQDVHDILLGAAILGTGGGGSLEEGLEIVDKAFNEDLEFRLADLDDLNGDDLIGTPYSCGSISPLSEKQQKEFDKLPKMKETPEVTAIRSIEKYFEKKLAGVVATELGGSNTAMALEASARLNIPIIDADPAGRSVPYLQQTTYFLKDIPIYPMAIANKFGDTMIVTNTVSDERAEALTRAAAVASFNHVGVVDHIGKWKDLREALIPNTISLCLSVGQIARRSKKENINLATTLVKELKGYFLFKGIVSAVNYEDKDGFTYGDLYVEGEDEFKGDKFRIWIQNENIISWKNDEIYVTVPDSINIIDNSKNMPLLNPDAKVGDNISIFALKSFDPWRTQKGLDVFGPKFFGYDIEYHPVEDIMNSSN
ncbi:MAG: DUF917 domain-containing protein [Promethearchaeota archaeon]